MSAGPLVVTYPLTGRSREIVAEELDGTAEAIYLVDLAPADRAHALGRAGAVLSHDTSKELRPDEILLIRNARLLQFTAAGVDWVPTRDLPRELPVAANKGGGAEPMSEHIVALALAAAKRLFIEHVKLKHGEFNQGRPGTVDVRRPRFWLCFCSAALVPRPEPRVCRLSAGGSEIRTLGPSLARGL